ncbi:insulinase family protein [Lactiplantibacillus plantarum]|nr:insulinase family protein [Lactiplantibacillus plantarum]
MSGFQTIAYGAGAPYGSISDPAGKSGLAHLTEHLIFETSSNKKMMDSMNKAGIAFNGATSFDFTLFYVQSLNEDDDLAKTFMENIFCNFDVSEEKMLSEKKLVIREIKHYFLDNFELLIAKLSANPDEIPILGSIESLERIKLADIYSKVEELKKFSNLISSDTDAKNTIIRVNSLNNAKVIQSKGIQSFYSKTVPTEETCYTVKIHVLGSENISILLQEFLTTLTGVLRSKGLIYRSQTVQTKNKDGMDIYFCVSIAKKEFKRTRELVLQYLNTFKDFASKNFEMANVVQKKQILMKDNPIGRVKTLFYESLQNVGHGKKESDFNESGIEISEATMES